MTKNKTFLPIYNDLVFKNLFGVSKNIKNTTNMLEEFFGFPKGFLDGSKITNSVTLDRETVNKKSFELDVKLEDPYGNIYNLEMQRTLDKEAEVKNSIYVMALFQGGLSKGVNYNKIKKVTQVEFVKNNLQHRSKDIISTYHITNDKDPSDKILEDLFSIHIVNIDQDKNKEYNNIKGFESWRRFIGSETPEELASISKGNEILESAMKESLRFMEQDYVQDFSREELLQESRLETAMEKGIEEGIKEGKIKGIIEGKHNIAKEMLNDKDLSLEKISLFTGLTVEELEKLKNEK